MRQLMSFAAVGAIVAVAAASFFTFRVLSRAGELTTLVPQFDGACRPLAGFIGAEDLVLDEARGVLYAAGEDRRAKRAGEATRGAIWALDWNDLDSARPDDLTDGAPADFHPLGIDLHIDADGTRRLFVVNRASAGHRLEVFQVTPAGRLAHERTFDDPALVNANDAAALGADRAYVSLDKTAATGSFGELVEGALERPNGRVALVSRDGVDIVADELRYANGLALLADGATLAVAETIGRSVALYDRDPDTNALALRERVFVGTGVDNITRDAAGRLFIAAHPKPLTFALGHARDASATAPSQVIVLEVEEQRGDQLFLSLGEDLSGSSAAVVDVPARRMAIGSVYEPHILACDLPDVWRHSEAHPASRPRQRELE